MFVLCYFFNIDMYIFDKINVLTYFLLQHIKTTYITDAVKVRQIASISII